jgi:hypothetical protein
MTVRLSSKPISRFAYPNESSVSFAIVVVKASIRIEVSEAAVPEERCFVNSRLLTQKGRALTGR